MPSRSAIAKSDSLFIVVVIRFLIVVPFVRIIYSVKIFNCAKVLNLLHNTKRNPQKYKNGKEKLSSRFILPFDGL